jgi:DNA-binding IclR family transcriptional regulator
MIDSTYHLAQRAIADLKGAILMTLRQAGPEGLSNADLGRKLGIYTGHKGHEGHISRTMLGMMEQEGVVEQEEETKRWRVANWTVTESA